MFVFEMLCKFPERTFVQFFTEMAGRLSDSAKTIRRQPNADATARIPDEVLCLVFSHISSLRHRFRLAAVNRKFRGCMMLEMKKKPMPLDVRVWCDCDYYEDWFWSFNGVIINRSLDDLAINRRLDKAVQALAMACKFSAITIDVTRREPKPRYLDRLYQIFSETDCLSQVRRFESKSLYWRSSACAKALAKWDQLSVLKVPLRLVSGPDFTRALKNKPLTQLVLTQDIADADSRQDSIELFQSLKLTMLRKLQLSYYKCPKDQRLLFPELIEQLRSAWMVLEEIHIDGMIGLTSTELNRAFRAFPGLPSLQLCHLKCSLIADLGFLHEFSSAFISLFSLGDRAKNLVLNVNERRMKYYGRSGCWFVGVIGQIRESHPALQTELNLSNFKLVVGSVSSVLNLAPSRCHNDKCEPCRHPQRHRTVVAKSGS